MSKRSRDPCDLAVSNILPGKQTLSSISTAREPTGIPEVGEAEGFLTMLTVVFFLPA